MSKEILLSQLTNAKNNYILGLAAISLLIDKKAQGLLADKHVDFGQYKLHFSQIIPLLQNENDKTIAISEFLKSHIRALLKETFELVKNYASDTNQLQLMKGQEWFHFARLIRNCLSHNFKFNFGDFDLGLLPIAWNDREITADMDNNELDLQFLNYVQIWELFRVIQNFAINDLE